MAKSVLISIKPKWCELIASGKKTVEVRKKRPKLKPPFKVYIYRTKGSVKHLCGGKWWNMPVGGTVIGEFVCDKIVEFENSWYDPAFYETSTLSCVDVEELARYIGKNDYGYSWHISNLVIYDKSKDLADFKIAKEFGGYEELKTISKPPQSWFYVEELKE